MQTEKTDLQHLPLVSIVAAVTWFALLAAIYWLIPGFSPGH